MLDEPIYAPITKGDKLGVVQIKTPEGEHSIDLLAANDINRKGINLILSDFFDKLLGKIE